MPKRAKAYIHCLAWVVDSLKGFTEAPTLTIYRIYPIFFNRGSTCAPEGFHKQNDIEKRKKEVTL